LPRSSRIDSGLPPGVLSQAVIPLKFGAGPQFTSVVALGLQSVSEVCRAPVTPFSCLRIIAEPCRAVE
jgi:hypothetical protein